jgi:hypothetical protein
VSWVVSFFVCFIVFTSCTTQDTKQHSGSTWPVVSLFATRYSAGRVRYCFNVRGIKVYFLSFLFEVFESNPYRYIILLDPPSSSIYQFILYLSVLTYTYLYSILISSDLFLLLLLPIFILYLSVLGYPYLYSLLPIFQINNLTPHVLSEWMVEVCGAYLCGV